MKKTFFLVAIYATAFTCNSFAHNSTQSPLLTAYYNIKDALVSGNTDVVSSGAELLIQSTKGTFKKLTTESNINSLIEEATAIAHIKDVKVQREQFANVSANMFAVAKALKLTGQPQYQVYSPMKKVFWLSRDKAIKNPYFGSAMLNCGKIVETIDE